MKVDVFCYYIIFYKLVKCGKVVLIICVINYKSKGGIYGCLEDMKLSVKGKDFILLVGEWKYLFGFLLSGIFFVFILLESNFKYFIGLFNVMIYLFIFFFF